MTRLNAMRVRSGVYWTIGGFEILHDNNEGGTGLWVVISRTEGTDNPLAFCKTLGEAREYIAAALARHQNKTCG